VSGARALKNYRFSSKAVIPGDVARAPRRRNGHSNAVGGRAIQGRVPGAVIEGSPSRGRYRTARDLSQTAAVAGGLGLIRLVGQLDLATHRITDDVPLAPHALQEFVIAGPAHPADRAALGPPLPTFLRGPILLPGTDVAGLIVWWDDFHVQISERPVGRTARWLHPLRFSFAYPTRSVRNRCDQSPRG
jgi:hypothetical protein